MNAKPEHVWIAMSCVYSHTPALSLPYWLLICKKCLLSSYHSTDATYNTILFWNKTKTNDNSKKCKPQLWVFKKPSQNYSTFLFRNNQTAVSEDKIQKSVTSVNNIRCKRAVRNYLHLGVFFIIKDQLAGEKIKSDIPHLRNKKMY